MSKALYVGTTTVLALIYLYGNLTVRGSATIHGNITGYNITATGSMVTPTLEATTVSGATLRDTAGTFLVSVGNARATTFEATTLSGATIRDTAGTFTCTAGVCTLTSLTATTAEATTVSGATLRTTAGDTVIDSSGIETLDTLSGSKLVINALSSGTGTVIIRGAAGGRICLPDTSGTMYALVVTGGTLQTRLPVSSECNQ